MNHAHRFLRTDEAGGAHPLPTARIMLPIRQHLKTATQLKAGPKAVLMEVCELHENGGKGCYASNDTLAKGLGISLATVVRTVAALVAGGLLTSRVVKAEANRRYLTPTATVRACYTGGTAEQQLLAASNLTIVKKEAATELTIVKPESDYSQNGEVTIVKSESDYSQNASRVYGDKQDKHLTSNEQAELASLRSALATAQIGLVALTVERDALLAEVTTLKAQRPAAHTKGGAAPAKPSAAKKLHSFDESPYADLATLQAALADTDYAHADLAYYHEVVRNWANGKGEKKVDWLSAIRGWILRDSRENKLKTTTGSQQTHGNVRSTSSHRSASGFDIEAAFALGSAIAHESAAGGAR